MALFVLARSPKAWVNRAFALTCLFLLTWLATLFLFNRTQEPDALLLVGRLNFASVPPASLCAYLFVRAVAQRPMQNQNARVALIGGTVALSLVSALTPLIDQAELPGTGEEIAHTTVYGPFFPLYAAYVAALLLAAVLLAFRQARVTQPPARDQLLLVGSGMLATFFIALVTNALLPFVFGNFRFTDVGPLSTVLFLGATAYAIAKHRLFNVRLLVRKTVVYGLLLSLVLAAYSSLLVLATDQLAGPEADTLTRFGVLAIAFSFDPVRRFLEHRVDKLLFHKPATRPRQTANAKRNTQIRA
jgi:hypothetical protein